ncbi:alpha-amylase family glycosyl hydrolase [Pseudoroseomonas cervicalis]|uniref:alpha-amylase family glycosyl hydrolase n=1 Tax=Teichococcus cervicalis TaxID=204525 RepID=UPI002789F19D|nr:alpha-amylase family glycosyl hydrolase [Pseudoroseomonas cervicalis]MDQ1078212.1 alpha-glucosidase [Pseudoroseomonas cervicalis]
MVAGADWWRGAVLYQVYPRSFADSDGDGIGDLKGIEARLEHIARLGVDAVWICPFYASPGRDFGYDVSDHLAVDPLFGSLEDVDRLLERAHALGLKVLVDLVGGHTSDAHPWFRRSRTGHEAPEADWYVWADPSPDGTPPNNWLSVFGGSAWSWEPRRRQYYLHHFLSSQPSLNLANPAALEALLAVGEFWLKRGVDGFRLDAVDFLAHDPELRSNAARPAPGGAVPAKLFGLQWHQHDMMHPQILEILRRIRALTDRYGAVTLGEVSSQDGAFERVLRYSSGEELLHMAYTLRPLRGGFDHAAVRSLLEAAEGGTEREGWPCWSFSNHDVERAVTRWNPAGREAPADPRFARLLASLLLSLRGSVCLYQGEELGLPEAELTLAQVRDPFGLTYWPEFKGRDGSRTPMPWAGGAPQAGFSSGEPWLPVPAAHHALAVDRQEEDSDSLLHAWRRLLALRRAHPALLRGGMKVLDLPAPLVGLVRDYAGQRVIALFNLSDAPVRCPVSSLTLLADGSSEGLELRNGLATLPPYGVLMGELDPVNTRMPAYSAM